MLLWSIFISPFSLVFYQIQQLKILRNLKTLCVEHPLHMKWLWRGHHQQSQPRSPWKLIYMLIWLNCSRMPLKKHDIRIMTSKQCIVDCSGLGKKTQTWAQRTRDTEPGRNTHASHASYAVDILVGQRTLSEWHNRNNQVIFTNYIGNGCFIEARRDSNDDVSDVFNLYLFQTWVSKTQQDCSFTTKHTDNAAPFTPLLLITSCFRPGSLRCGSPAHHRYITSTSHQQKLQQLCKSMEAANGKQMLKHEHLFWIQSTDIWAYPLNDAAPSQRWCWMPCTGV